MEKNYVKVKDLEVGRMYGGWRNWHIYLGRTQNKGFMWLYIGNPETYLKDPIREIIWSLNYKYSLQITKQNKKIEISPGELGKYILDLKILPKYILDVLQSKGLIIK